MKKVLLGLLFASVQVFFLCSCAEKEDENKDKFYAKMYSFLYESVSSVKSSLLNDGYHYIYGDYESFIYGKINLQGDTNIVMGYIDTKYNYVSALYYLQNVDTKANAYEKELNIEKEAYNYFKGKNKDLSASYILYNENTVDTLYDRSDYISVTRNLDVDNINTLFGYFYFYKYNKLQVIMLGFGPSDISMLYNYHGEEIETPNNDPMEWGEVDCYEFVFGVADYNKLSSNNKSIKDVFRKFMK